MPDHHLDHQAQLHGADSGLSGQFGTLYHTSLTCSGVFHRDACHPESRVAPCPAYHVVGEQDCLKAIAAEQKKERNKTFWGSWTK